MSTLEKFVPVIVNSVIPLNPLSGVTVEITGSGLTATLGSNRVVVVSLPHPEKSIIVDIRRYTGSRTFLILFIKIAFIF